MEVRPKQVSEQMEQSMIRSELDKELAILIKQTTVSSRTALHLLRALNRTMQTGIDPDQVIEVLDLVGDTERMRFLRSKPADIGGPE